MASSLGQYGRGRELLRLIIQLALIIHILEKCNCKNI